MASDNGYAAQSGLQPRPRRDSRGRAPFLAQPGLHRARRQFQDALCENSFWPLTPHRRHGRERLNIRGVDCSKKLAPATCQTPAEEKPMQDSFSRAGATMRAQPPAAARKRPVRGRILYQIAICRYQCSRVITLNVSERVGDELCSIRSSGRMIM